MKNNPPKDHHYIPQHFLKEWQSSKGKVIRYRRVGLSKSLEVKEVAIRRTAFEEDLYKVIFPDGSFEFESILVTPLIDEAGHKVLNQVRDQSIFELNKAQRIEIARYLTCLEARNPEIIEAMSQIPFEDLRQDFYERGGKRESVDEIVDYYKSLSTIGALAFSMFIQQEYKGVMNSPFHLGFANSLVIERILPFDGLLTSNYPAVRYGDYQDDLFFAVAISRKKFLLFSKNSDVAIYEGLSDKVLQKIINLLTLRKATCAYFFDDSMAEFVDEHLAWGNRFETEKASLEYFRNFVLKELETEAKVEEPKVESQGFGCYLRSLVRFLRFHTKS